ncbi:MAG: 2-isopropylmalate synthase [Rhodospirillaceae bacterium]|jgi:2-isopropylmalate synthase|nr:2-isopropylmalate synthase [Rhodospirillaceae bacterium]MBT4937971.1 2-isopropylmalate synthase [Rhodospirillaceae bacterium]MBT5941008.1 2-isopropylmalate synthase [Rhodospirillaceae bacterium]
MTTKKSKNDIIIFDTTLRDGEQSPGASMNLSEKIRIAEVLEDMGVDVIEAGFPIASDGDFEAVNEIAKLVKGSTICGLARSSKGDIDRCAEAIKPAESGRIHTFISTSPLHMKYKLQMEPEDVHQAVIDSVTHARNFTDDVEWSCEDGSRTEHDFMCRTIESAIDAGATTINIPDTVGYAMPMEYAAMIEMVMNRVPNVDKAVISVHCHNDLGMAVANSLAAVQVGARQIECTINGLGERAGNAAMEEIVMGLRTRSDYLPYNTNIKSELITKASKLVSTVTGFSVQPNKAIVGANAFAHESGIHQDGMLKNAQTYEIMTPESIGLTESKLVMGKHSGRHAFREKLIELGYDLGDNAVQDAFKRFKDLADVKKDVYDEDIVAIVDDAVIRDNDTINLEKLEVLCGTEHQPPKASMTLNVDGEQKSAEMTGDGPVDAIFKGIKELTGIAPHLQLYQVHAVTQGTDAQAEVTVRLEEDGKTVNGQGADTDTMVASARAYINALNKLLVKREKSAPSALSA